MDCGQLAAAVLRHDDENKDDLFFSDTEGFQFKIDEEAKAQRIPTETLRDWSSETINYRLNSPSAKAKH